MVGSVMYRLEFYYRYMGLDFGGVDTRVSKHLLNTSDIGTVIHHQGGYCVIEQVTPFALACVGLFDVLCHQAAKTVGAEGTVAGSL